MNNKGMQVKIGENEPPKVGMLALWISKQGSNITSSSRHVLKNPIF